MIGILCNDAKHHRQWLVVRRQHLYATPEMIAGPFYSQTAALGWCKRVLRERMAA